MTDYKTLRELEVKPGDVVSFQERVEYTIFGWKDGYCYHVGLDNFPCDSALAADEPGWRVVSRAPRDTPSPKAIVRAALERVAERIAYQHGTIYDEDNLETMAWVRGNNSAVSSALAITWSIASSPAEVAAIIKAAKEDRG